MSKGPVSQFIAHHYRHFNAAALMDAAKGYETHLLEGGKMLVSLAGAMSTAELGISLAEMIQTRTQLSGSESAGRVGPAGESLQPCYRYLYPGRRGFPQTAAAYS